jgi:hypothetical protein
MTNTTATVAPEHNIVAMKAQFDDFTARGNKAGETLQAAIPLTGRPLPAQEAFLFALADIKLLQHLMETVQNTFNGINLQAATPEQLAEGGDFAQSLAELAGEMIEAMVENFGLSKEIIMPTCIKDLARDLALVETIIVRLEASVAIIAAE